MKPSTANNLIVPALVLIPQLFGHLPSTPSFAHKRSLARFSLTHASDIGLDNARL